MDRSEVEIPYRGGPLDGQRELLERWELEEGGDASDGDVYEHREYGSTEPAERYRLFGDVKQGHPDCRGHLTHDHGDHAACYVGDGWLSHPSEMPGCPRGCSRENHPGTWTTRRPDRVPRDQTAVP